MTETLSGSSPDRGFPNPWEVCYDTPFGKFCIPITSTGPIVPPGPSTLPPIALASGELHGKLFRAALLRYRAAGNDRNRFLRGEVAQLLSHRAIRASEVPLLHEIVDVATDRDGRVPNERLRAILAELVDNDGSAMAVTIASIAVNAGTQQADTGGAVAAADIGGAIVGGVGGALLNPALAIPGAIFGSAITSLTTAAGAV